MSDPDVKREDLALEELRQLQAIIARYEGLGFQIRGWLLVLVGALVAAILKNLPPALFLLLNAFVVPVFALMELVTRGPKRRAIQRVGEVEGALRGEQVYDGPLIHATLSGSLHNRWTFAFAELRVINFWAFYGALLLVAVVVALSIGSSVGWSGRFDP
jgi:hypothetical protein